MFMGKISVFEGKAGNERFRAIVSKHFNLQGGLCRSVARTHFTPAIEPITIMADGH